MVMAVATMHDENMLYMSPWTWDKNGLEYCETHGYPYSVLTDHTNGMSAGWAKIDMMIAICEENPNVEWLFWKDCDSLITNFKIKIEDIVDNEYHVLLTTQWCGINAGMLLVRNSEEGRAWLKMLMSNWPTYKDHPVAEQQCMIDTYEAWKHIIKIVPQRTYNAGCWSDGAHLNCPIDDTLGTSGQWQPGDFAMHWPGQPPELRVNLIRKYLPQVIR